MNSSKKSSSTILSIIKPKKRRAVFFVLLAIFVLGFSVKNSFAATYTASQKYDLEKTFGLDGTQITNLEKSNTTFDDFTKKVNDALDSPTYKDKTSADSIKTAANSVYNDVANPATMYSNTGSDVGGQVNIEGENLLVKALLGVVIGVLSIIVYFLKYLVSWSGALVDLVLNPNLYSFTSNTMIVQGWTVVRDVCNLFFLLILLFIAICTILKIEKYHAKKTLLMLIIMALLINFSKPIAIFIFDGSQLLMNFFLNQLNSNSQSPSTIYNASAEIANSIYKNIPEYLGNTKMGSPEIALIYLFSTIFLFVLAVAYLVTAIMLIIRIVAIMILIIVSPLAFFAAIIPDFSKMSSKWWSALFEYSYYGPAAAFFLLLATKLTNSLPNLGDITVKGNADVTTIISNMVQYLVVIIFLYASIIMAKQFGGGAGAAIVGNADRALKWAGGMSKGGGMWGSGARGVAGVSRATGVTGGIQQAIGASRFGKYLTKKGRETALKDREAGVAEGLGVEGAKEAREKQKVAEQREQWKKEGKTEGDFKKSLRSKNPIERKAAALELVKQGKVKDDETYERVLDSLKGSHATVGDAIANDHDEVKDAIKEVGKKRIDLVANEEAKRTGVDKLEVGVKLMGKANPGSIKDWDIEKITVDPKLEQALKNTYAKYDTNSKIQEKILEDMPATKYAAFIKTLEKTTPPPDVPWS